MRYVRLAFYKSGKGGLSDKIIAGWTWPWNIGTNPYSHVEIGWQNQENGTWKYFSSSIRDGGTRFKWGPELLKNPERWDVYEKGFSDDVVIRMAERAQSLLGKPYDWYGIFGFITVTGQVNKKDHFYCSEVVWQVLTGMWKKRISPRRLSSRIIKTGWKKVVL
jgi:uncharacterized protein YycO